MISVLDSSVIDRGFDPPLIQNKEPPSSPPVLVGFVLLDP